MTDICHTCGDRWCSERHGAAWDPPLCPACGASWECACRGGSDGEWRINGAWSLAQAMAREPVNQYGNLPVGSGYRVTLIEDGQQDFRYVQVDGGHVRPSPNPTIWPRPGWREQAAAESSGRTGTSLLYERFRSQVLFDEVSFNVTFGSGDEDGG